MEVIGKKALITISNLEIKEKKTQKTLLKIPDLIINEGDIVVINGNNASGKSIFLKMISNRLNGDFQISDMNGKPRQAFLYSEAINGYFNLLTEKKEILFHLISDFFDKEQNAPLSANLIQSLRQPFESINANNYKYNIKALQKKYDNGGASEEKKINSKLNELLRRKTDNQCEEKEKEDSYLYRFKAFIDEKYKAHTLQPLHVRILSKIPFLKPFSEKISINERNFYREKNKNLSSGQKQALFLFQTMLFSELLQTPITIFDEPLNYLDFEKRIKMTEEMTKFIRTKANPKGAVFIVSHRVNRSGEDFDFINPLISFFKDQPNTLSSKRVIEKTKDLARHLKDLDSVNNTKLIEESVSNFILPMLNYLKYREKLNEYKPREIRIFNISNRLLQEIDITKFIFS